jgi:hypothetical protein
LGKLVTIQHGSTFLEFRISKLLVITDLESRARLCVERYPVTIRVLRNPVRAEWPTFTIKELNLLNRILVACPPTMHDG